MATYYFRSTGTNWGTTGDWSATPSPTYSAGAVPTTLDNAVFEAASANCIINAGATRNCLNLTCTSYTGTLTFDTELIVTGNVALGSSSMTMAGSSSLRLTPGTTLSLSSLGCICSVTMIIQKSTGTATLTWGSNWTQSGAFILSGTTAWTWNGNTITFKGSSVQWNNLSSVVGTSALVFAPDLGTTMNITSSTNARWAMASVTINGAGDVNINISLLTLSTIFTHINGAVTHTGTILLAGFNTFDASGMSFQNCQTNNSTNTTTLISDLNFTGNFTIPSSIANINGPGINVNIGGNFTNNNAGGSPSGTAKIVMTGTGTISGTSTGNLSNTLIINTSGTITFSGTISWLRTFIFTSGTIVSTGSTVACPAVSSFTINNSGFNLANFSALNNVVFSGTHGCTFETYTGQGTGVTHTFGSNLIYTTNSLTFLGVASNNAIIRSSTPGTTTILTVPYGGSLDVGHVTATDIDSSNGRTIWVYKGTIGAATLNWQQLPTIPKTIGVPWVR